MEDTISYLVFDLEIKNCIPKKGEPKDESLKYCEGWGDRIGMGISVLCAYSSLSDQYRFFDDHNKDSFFDLVGLHDITVGFNSILFDCKVVDECWQNDLLSKGHYDICDQIFRRIKKRVHLDQLSKWNGLAGKSEKAEMAPILYQTGHYSELFNYCKDDVALTKDLFENILFNKKLIISDSGEEILFEVLRGGEEISPL